MKSSSPPIRTPIPYRSSTGSSCAGRWKLPYEEAREHLGLETQRQWSEKAIQRTTPILLGLFSIVTWITFHLTQNEAIPIQKIAWYPKEKVTFSDCLFMVRKHIWQTQIHNYVISTPQEDIIQFTPDILDLLLELGYPKAAKERARNKTGIDRI